MFVLPMLSAATTIVSPVASGNYSTTMLVNVTTAVANTLNVTCYYNASGGEATTLLVAINNSSTGQTTFTNAAVAISSLTEVGTYNISCTANGDTTEKSAPKTGIRIDNTVPTTFLALESSSISTMGNVRITWSSSDSGAGLSTVVTNITGPNSGSCATLSYTDTSKTVSINGQSTKCEGTYTVLVTATDYSGNVGTSTATFKAEDSGLSKSGSNTLGGTDVSQFSQGKEVSSTRSKLGETGTNVAILVLVIAGAYLFFKKK
jgi:hypothetical protein